VAHSHSAGSFVPAHTSAQQATAALLQDVVEEYLEPFFARCAQQGRSPQPFVRREFLRFLDCQDLDLGYVGVVCPECNLMRKVPFSCKRRGFCPCCLGRRMLDRAAFLTDQVLGDIPVRHLSIAFPPPLRYLLPYDPDLVTELLQAYTESLFHSLRWRAKRILGLASVNHAHPGAVTAIHRCSSNLQANIHFHSIVPDGVFVCESPGGPVVFRELPAPTDDEVAGIASDFCRRTRDILVRRGLWTDLPVDADEAPLAGEGSSKAPRPIIHGLLSMGPHGGQREVRYFGRAAQSDEAVSQPDPAGYSFDLYARRAVSAGDRKGLEAMAQYILRPPLAGGDLTRESDERIVLHLRRARRDGTTEVALEPLELMDKLAALIPRPRANTLRFHGVYAANAHLREQVVPRLERPMNPEGVCQDRSRRSTWAELLRRVFGVDLFTCPRCSSRMQRIAYIVDRYGVERPLHAAGQFTEPPVAQPAAQPHTRTQAH
jgi:hypothetical protein